MDQSEKGLIERLQQGDKPAFDYIFRANYSGLCAYARTYVRYADTAEELVQEVFVRIWERHERLVIHSSLKAYLYQSVFNACMTEIKASQTEAAVHVGIDDPAVRNELLVSAPGIDDFDLFFSEEAEKDLSEAIGSLPGQCREIFTLCRFGNLSYGEISARLNVSSSTVKTQMSRAMTRIMEQMKKYF